MVGDMPRGSMLKYFQDDGGPDSEHGAPLHWPGTQDGFPLRGEVAPDLKQKEYENIPLGLDFKSGKFDLDDDESKARFDLVMDRIVNGWYMQHRRDDYVDPETNHRMVSLEWVQIYGETPHGKTPGVKQHAKPITANEPQAAELATNHTGQLRTIGRRQGRDPLGWPQFG